jgi:hypothetical protein
MQIKHGVYRGEAKRNVKWGLQICMHNHTPPLTQQQQQQQQTQYQRQYTVRWNQNSINDLEDTWTDGCKQAIIIG